MPFIKLHDQLHRPLQFEQPPKRIVSLVPSITYSLHYFGIDSQVAGITYFCKYPPEWRKNKAIIGGTKNFKIEKIAALHPDLILASKEENPKDLTLELSSYAQIYVSDVHDLSSNYKLLEDLGKILQKESETKKITKQLNKKIESLQSLTKKRYKTVYMIWKEPWMSVGGDTFIHQMMQLAGFDNIYKYTLRYPVINLQDLQKIFPEVILLASEPYPFKEKDKQALQKLFPNTKILLVDGEPFTWFGTFPMQAVDYFKHLIEQLY